MQRPPAPETVASQLVIASGTATAAARLSAFDAALYEAGLHDANLLSVSSIVPAEAEVIGGRDRSSVADAIHPGSFVPAVYAFEASDEPGDVVHAAIAGARLASGHGVNVEHHGINRSPDEIRTECDAMLEEMALVRDTAILDETWYRCESIEVPNGGAWAGAVSAMAYLDGNSV